ncbi:hypothetical protein [Streptomyces sp. NPDC017993]|uniref:hypothetical protein n=1 Tax=Streptomyces sp. NPDC017993 TaxID=3365027 RepID=UPI0037A03AE7
MGPLYDAGAATSERILNKILYLTLGALLLPPLLIALAVHHQEWHLAALAPVLLPWVAAWLALRAKHTMRMGQSYAACALLVLGTPATAGLLAWLSGDMG